MVQQDFTKIILRIVFFVNSNRTKVNTKIWASPIYNSISICETRKKSFFFHFFLYKTISFINYYLELQFNYAGHFNRKFTKENDLGKRKWIFPVSLTRQMFKGYLW